MDKDFDPGCEPPRLAEVGDDWICPGCARKYHYVHFTYEDFGMEFDAWTTTEIG